MTEPLDLTHVQQQFDQWRQTRASRREPIPNALREQAVRLCEQYRPSRVIDALRINHTMLKTWRQPESRVDFVPIDLPLSPPPLPTNAQITLTHPNGTQLQINGFDTQSLGQLIQHFVLAQVGDA